MIKKKGHRVGNSSSRNKVRARTWLTSPEAVAPALSLSPTPPCPRGEASALRHPHGFCCLPHLFNLLLRGGLRGAKKGGRPPTTNTETQELVSGKDTTYFSRKGS